MLKTLNSFTPNFLKKIDKHLLLNYPDIWATKVHHVAFWGSIYFLLLTGFAWTYPLATDNVPEMGSVFLISMLPGAIAALYWVYQLSLFRIEKNFGLSNSETRFRTQLLYVAVIAFLGMSPYYYSSILHSRIGNLVSMKTMKQDLENLESFDAFIKSSFYQYDPATSNLYATARNCQAVTTIEATSFLTFDKSYFPFDSELEKEQTVEYSDQVLLKMAEKAFHSFNKYSPEKITNFELNEKEDNLIVSNYNFREKYKQNVRSILYAQYGLDFFGENNMLAKGWTLFLLSVIVLLFIFMRVEAKTFLMAGVTGFALVMGFAMFGQAIQAFLGLGSTEVEKLISLVFFGILVAMGIIAYATRNTKRFGIVRQISLILLSIGIAFTPTVLMLNFLRQYSNDDYAFYWLGGGVLFAWGMWNTFFAAKMRQLYLNTVG
jgi:hypothetical protein